MKKQLLSLLAAGVSGLIAPHAANATTYAGNGSTGFNGAVGNGMLSVTNNASGAFVFAFTLGGGQTNFGGNDLVIYVDNNKGLGIGNSTGSLTDASDGGRQAISGYSGSQRSTLSFNSLLSPQFALNITPNNGNVFGLLNNSPLNFLGGQTITPAAQSGGVTFAVTTSGANTVLTTTVPASLFNLTANTAGTIKLLAIQVSETGYSSSEATVGLTGGPQGYGTTQTISAVNSFTTVPEPGTWAMMLLGGIGTLLVVRRRGLFAR